MKAVRASHRVLLSFWVIGVTFHHGVLRAAPRGAALMRGKCVCRQIYELPRFSTPALTAPITRTLREIVFHWLTLSQQCPPPPPLTQQCATWGCSFTRSWSRIVLCWNNTSKLPYRDDYTHVYILWIWWLLNEWHYPSLIPVYSRLKFPSIFAGQFNPCLHSVNQKEIKRFMMWKWK